MTDPMLLAYIAKMALRQQRDGYHVSICPVCHTLSAGNGMGGVCMNGHVPTRVSDAARFIDTSISDTRDEG